MTKSHNIFSNLSPAEYAEVSVLAQLTGDNMLARLELVTLQPKVILDLGCGTGYCTTLLKQQYANAEVIAVDYSEAMLRYYQQSEVENLLCADVTSLPFKTQSVDFIFANLLLPWCNDWENIFREWRRVLRPDGLLMFSCFGPDTLRELQNDAAELPICKDMHEIGDTLVHAKFSDPVMDVETLTMTYREREKLIYELHATGMLPFNVEPRNSENLSAVTYEIVYGHTWGPDASVDHVADESGVVKIPLSFLRRRI